MSLKKSNTLKDTAEQSHCSQNLPTGGTSPGFPWGLALTFFFLVGVFLFLRSPFFLVKNYVIKGANKVTHAEIIARSIQKSQNIFDLDLDKAQRTIESSPWIKRACCNRRLPDTILIDVVERKPIAFAPAGGKMWLVDEEGRVLQEDDGKLSDLVAFTGVKGMLAPGQFLEPHYIWGLRIIECLGSVSKDKVIELNIEDKSCILILDDGCKVFMVENGSEPEAQIELLESILKELEEGGKHAEYIDLRFDKHAVRLKL